MSKTYMASYTQQLLDNLARDGFNSAEYKYYSLYRDVLWDTIIASGSIYNSRLLYYIVLQDRKYGLYEYLRDSLPIGIEMTVPNSVYGDIDCILIAKDDLSYSLQHKNGLLFMTKKIICKHCFDAKESTNPVSGRSSHGNNRYSQSNILQWLNSAKPKGGQWYKAQHEYDAAPNNTNTPANAYVNEAGFLCGFDRQFLDQLKSKECDTVLPSEDGGGTETVSTFLTYGGTAQQKMFLLSASEVNISGTGALEGAAIPYFTDNESRQAAVLNGSNGINNSWWLRTSDTSSTNQAYIITADGGLDESNVDSGTVGVRPAFII